MPLQETVNQGREFLDQFGAEGEGWKPIDLFEALELPEVPQELLIPSLSATAVALYQEKLQPARPEKSARTASVLLRECQEVDPFSSTFGWGEENGAHGEIIGVQSSSYSLNTLHTYGYHGYFKPTAAEVLGAIDKSDRYEPGDKMEYYWTEPFSDENYGVMWPNIAVEVQHQGEVHSITAASYHLGRTIVSSLAAPKIAEGIIKAHERAVRKEQIA